VFWTHQPNMARLRRGEEHRFSRMGKLNGRAGTVIAAVVMAVGAAWLHWGGMR
jgi:hypothetical protein